MDKLPDEILLRIFSFIHFTERIILRTVSRQWSALLYDHSLLQNISISKSYCEDHQLTSLFTNSKRLITVDFFNSRSLNGSCILLAGLSTLRRLTLTGELFCELFCAQFPGNGVLSFTITPCYRIFPYPSPTARIIN